MHKVYELGAITHSGNHYADKVIITKGVNVVEEKVIISSKQYNMKKVFRIALIIALVLSVSIFIYWVFSEYLGAANYYESNTRYDTEEYETYLAHKDAGSCGRYINAGYDCTACMNVKYALNLIKEYSTKEAFAISEVLDGGWFLDMNDCPLVMVLLLCLVPAVVICIIMGLYNLCLSSSEMTVSNKRVYGKAAFGKRVDLPLDSISAVGTSWLKGISVATSSGRISFLLIKNRDEIHKCISNLLVDRQNRQPHSTTIKQEMPQSNADDLRKYKELLDDGIITQEEFDAKKKQLLGL